MTRKLQPLTMINSEDDAELCGPDGCLIPATASVDAESAQEPGFAHTAESSLPTG